MAESGLSIGFPTLQIEVGEYLGIGPTAADWSTKDAALVDRIIQSGLRQFYYPPVDRYGDVHNWSFLNPTTTITTVADQWEYDLPDAFSRILGDLHYAASVSMFSIPIIGYGSLLEMRSQNEDSYKPTVAAVRFKTADGTTGQRNQLLLHSPPDGVYVLTYRYEAYNGALSLTNPYPLGGMKYAETIISSCLAVAEIRANGEESIHGKEFLRNLATAIASDKVSGAKNFGQMGASPDTDSSCSRYDGRSNGVVTYNGDIL